MPYGTVLALFMLALQLAAVHPVSAAPLGKRLVLDNGITLIVAERPKVPMVVMDVLIEAGAVAELEDKAGLANLTAELLTQGAVNRTATEIARDIDFMGASLSTSADYDYAEVRLIVLKKYADKGTGLLRDILVNPSFPQDEIGRKVREIQGEIIKNEEDPGWVAKHKFLQIFFKDHPYSRMVIGNKESLMRIGRDDVIDFHSHHYRPNGVIVSIAGDISLEEAKDLINKNFGGWSEKEVNEINVSAPPPLKEVISIELDRKVAQANITLGHLGITRDNPDYYPLQVMNYILGGGGFSSRLVNVIRDKKGFAYHVSSHYISRKYSGYFQVELQTKNPSAKEATELVLENMEKIRRKPVSDKELEDAKSYLIGSLPLKIETNREVAAQMALLEFYDLGLDYFDKYPGHIKAVSKKDVLTVAKKYLHPEKVAIVVVADLEEANIN